MTNAVSASAKRDGVDIKGGPCEIGFDARDELEPFGARRAPVATMSV